MNKMLKFLSFSLLVILIGCNVNNGEENIFRFKDTFVGDNSAVGGIVDQLWDAEHFKTFELETKKEPYGIILNYEGSDTEQNNKRTAIYNATFLFTLVQNADWITFYFDDQAYKITKENLQNWYGEDFNELQNEDELQTLVQGFLEDEDKIDRLFQ